jgi:hypothetical protein
MHCSTCLAHRPYPLCPKTYTGIQVFRDALILLENPQAMYERGSETVRSILNRAFFTKLYIDDDRRVSDHQLKEPFDVLADAYHIYKSNRPGKTPLRHDATVPTSNSAALTDEYCAANRATLIDSLSLALAGQVSSKPVMVELRGLEPLTPCMQGRCATGLRHSPEICSPHYQCRCYVMDVPERDRGVGRHL